MRVFLSLITFLAVFAVAHAQGVGNVSGLIKGSDDKAEVPAGTTVTLLRAKDSATVKFTLTNKDGSYAFDKIANGKYLIAATAVGYKKSFSAPFEITTDHQRMNVTVVELSALPKSLAGVTVTAKRP